MSHKSSMHGGGESYSGVVLTKQNTPEPNSRRTPRRGSGHSGLERVREAAKKDKKLKFTALLHHVSIDLLRDSYDSLKKKAAPGVDGVTWEEYGRDLEARLSDLHGRIHRGAYRARPSRRTWISKSDGRQRPLGIAALEDKVVQSAVGTVLNQIWEEDFLGFSYGFRPGRGQQDALDALWVGIVRKKVNWILDLDIRSFFDKLQHDWLVRFVEHRKAGLVTGAGYDAYVRRIVFPLEGNLYGRSLSASAPPHRFLPGAKGGLYSWDQVRWHPEVILVEGLFDYAALWEAGFRNVTCSLGTHLNARQIGQLCDGPRTAYLAFDADTNGRGQKAAQSLARRLTEQGVKVRIASLPDGNDPNSFFVQDGNARQFQS